MAARLLSCLVQTASGSEWPLESEVKCLFARASMTAVFSAMTVGLASAQGSVVTLPDAATGSTVLTATVSEQARVTVPVAVAFAVTNVSKPTTSTALSVTVDGIVTADNARLKTSITASAASFVAADGGTTWSASDVSWNAATFSNGGSGASGTLANGAYNTVAVCTADVESCSAVDLVFTLAAKPTITRSGPHTLTMAWKFESF